MQGKHYYSKFKRMDYDLARNAFHHTFLSPKALQTTRVVNVWRRHPFERLVCLARDCIVHNSSLHMVDASGKWIDNCLDKGFNFDRHRAMVRKYGVKVYIDPAWAEAQARELVHLGDSQADFLRSIGFTDFETVATEDLDAFEYDSAHIDDSVDAWLAWMRSWGVDADATLVRRVITMGWPKAGQGAGVSGHMNARLEEGSASARTTRHLTPSPTLTPSWLRWKLRRATASVRWSHRSVCSPDAARARTRAYPAAACSVETNLHAVRARKATPRRKCTARALQPGAWHAPQCLRLSRVKLESHSVASTLSNRLQ